MRLRTYGGSTTLDPITRLDLLKRIGEGSEKSELWYVIRYVNIRKKFIILPVIFRAASLYTEYRKHYPKP